MISVTTSSTRMLSRVGVREERSEHTYRSARRHVTHVCCAIVVFSRAHRREHGLGIPAAQPSGHGGSPRTEAGCSESRPWGKEVTRAEQVWVDSAESPVRKKEDTQQDTAEQPHASGTTTSGFLSLSRSLSRSLSHLSLFSFSLSLPLVLSHSLSSLSLSSLTFFSILSSLFISVL